MKRTINVKSTPVPGFSKGSGSTCGKKPLGFFGLRESVSFSVHPFWNAMFNIYIAGCFLFKCFSYFYILTTWFLGLTISIFTRNDKRDGHWWWRMPSPTSTFATCDFVAKLDVRLGILRYVLNTECLNPERRHLGGNFFSFFFFVLYWYRLLDRCCDWTLVGQGRWWQHKWAQMVPDASFGSLWWAFFFSFVFY